MIKANKHKGFTTGWWETPIPAGSEIKVSARPTDCYEAGCLAPIKPLADFYVCPGQSGKQEGINPMRYETVAAPTAIASITATSDDQKKIDYLNERARSISRDIDVSFYEMFNIHSTPRPRYYKDLIDAIKNGDYEIDEKAAKQADELWENSQDEDDEDHEGYYHNAFFGINFTKFPKPDYKGLEKARRELSDELTRIKDIIAIMPADEALKAVQEFQSWKPSNAPTK